MTAAERIQELRDMRKRIQADSAAGVDPGDEVLEYTGLCVAIVPALLDVVEAAECCMEDPDSTSALKQLDAALQRLGEPDA